MAVYYEVYEGSNSLPTYFFKEEWAHYSPPLYRCFTKMWIDDGKTAPIQIDKKGNSTANFDQGEFTWVKLSAQRFW